MIGSPPARVAADLMGLATAAAIGIHRVVVLHTAKLEAEVKRNASERPGPNVRTGNYRRSINRQTTRRAAFSEGQVGSSHPAARRLEYGFSGTDSLGRNYDQAPLPHFAPALDSIAPDFIEAIGDVGSPSRRGSR